MPNAPSDTDRFADALIALGSAADCLPRIEEELSRTLPVMVRDERVRSFLADPTVLSEGKRKAIEELLGARMHPALLCFLCFLADTRRIQRLEEIAVSFFEKVCATRKETDGELVSAAPLGKETVAAIEKEVGRVLLRTVRLRPRVQPELLGGLYVHVGDFVIDGTLDRQLTTLGHALLS